MIGTQSDCLNIVLGNYFLKDVTNLLGLNGLLKLNYEVTATGKVDTLAESAGCKECNADDGNGTENSE